MTITNRVRQAFFHQAQPQQDVLTKRNQSLGLGQSPGQLIRIPQTKRQCKVTLAYNGGHHFTIVSSSASLNASGHNQTWTPAEHERFLEALEFHPRGPWKCIAEFVGTKTARQAMSHAQKYRQKIARRQRGLQVYRGRRVASSPTPTREVHVVAKPDTNTLQCDQHNKVEDPSMWCSSPAPSSEQSFIEIDSPTSLNEVGSSMVSNELDWESLSDGQLFIQEPLAAVPIQQEQCLLPAKNLLVDSLSGLLDQSDADHEMMLRCVSEFLDEADVFGSQQVLDYPQHEEANRVFYGAWLTNSTVNNNRGEPSARSSRRSRCSSIYAVVKCAEVKSEL